MSRIHVACLNVRDGEAEGRLIVETSRQLHGEQFILQWKWQGGHWITASVGITKNEDGAQLIISDRK